MYLLLAFILIGETGGVYWNSGYVKGLNQKSDKYKEAAVAEADARTIAAGDIYDRNHEILVKNENPGENSIYSDDYAYSQIIGYTGPAMIVYGTEVSEVQRGYRLMEYYRDELYDTEDINGTKGKDIVLTLDHKLQVKVKELLLQEMNMEDRGSAVVMNAKTGEILAMVSFPGFNANKLDESIQKMAEADKENEVYFPITHKGAAVPGSIFKIITAVSMLDNGMEDFTSADDNFKVDEAWIVNDYGSAGDRIDYHEGIVRSSNVFFARAALELGGKKLDETAKKFKIGEYLESDFGSIVSNWGLDTSNQTDIAYTAFGQGKTLFSTVYGAMAVQAIANDGIMMQPYVVKEILNTDGFAAVEGKQEILSKVTGTETADKITKAMVEAVQSHIGQVEGEENQEVYINYPIAGKTGTGETGDGQNTNNAWFISFAPADDPQYVVVVNQCRTYKYGYQLMDTAAGIYRYLFAQEQG